MNWVELFHGHAFGEIFWLVDGAATDAGDVVGEELEGNGSRDDGGELWAVRDFDDVVTDAACFLVSSGDDAEQRGIAGFALCGVAE